MHVSFQTKQRIQQKKKQKKRLKYLGLGGALGLGGLIAYGLSRPTQYVDRQTRDMMSVMGGASFAQTVRQRVFKTYAYLTGSIALTGASCLLLLSRGNISVFLAFVSS